MLDKYLEIFENNKKWILDKTAQDPGYFSDLAKEQNPDFLFIGCSDSRVPANEITGLETGKLFVHRNIANQVVGTDMNVQSVIDYATNQLGVKYIIVCGHYGCDGIKAAMQHKDYGLLHPWISHIRDVYRIHQKELNSIRSEESRYKRLIELNVQEQCINLCKSASVQKSFAEVGYPVIHGWTYDLKNGKIIDLNLDFSEIIKSMTDIYTVVDDEVEYII